MATYGWVVTELNNGSNQLGDIVGVKHQLAIEPDIDVQFS